MFLAVASTVGAFPANVLAFETADLDSVPVVEAEPFTARIYGEDVVVSADGIARVNVRGFRESVEMSIPRYIYIDGEAVAIDDDRIENISPVVVSPAPFSARANQEYTPSVGFIASVIGSLPTNPVINHAGQQYTHAAYVRMNGNIVHSRRYFVFINDVGYEAFCADPNLPGPEHGSSIYALTGEARAALRTVLRYGFPINPSLTEGISDDDRSWNAYLTRVSVAYVSRPNATWGGITGETRVAVDARVAGTGGAAAKSASPAITVNGNADYSMEGVSPQSPLFTLGHSRRTNCNRNPFRFEWGQGTPAGTRLYVNGAHIATAPTNPATIFSVNNPVGIAGQFTEASELHVVMPQGSEGQTARVNLVGINNSYAGRAFVMRHPSNPVWWQDIVFYIPEVLSYATYLWDYEPSNGNGNGNGNRYGEIVIYKREVSNGVGNNQPLSGAHFRIQGGNPPNAVDRTGVTDENGRLVFRNLPAGTFTVTEIAPPSGFLLGNNNVWHVTLAYGQTVSRGTAPTHTFFNAPKSSLDIIKVCAATGERLAGAVFELTDPTTGYSWQATTDANGLARIGTGEYGNFLYPDRTFVLIELQAPPGFSLDSTPRNIVLSPGNTNEITVMNHRMPTITIIKRDLQTGVYIDGAEFRIEKLDDPGSGALTGNPFVTGRDGSGRIILPFQHAGRYRIVETRAANNYFLDPLEQNRSWIITVRPNEDYVLEVFNTLLPTLVITKWNMVTMRPVPLTHFRVEHEMPNSPNVVHIGDFVTDTNGQIILPFVSVGWYRITEIFPAPGMALNTNNNYRVFLSPGDNTYRLLSYLRDGNSSGPQLSDAGVGDVDTDPNPDIPNTSNPELPQDVPPAPGFPFTPAEWEAKSVYARQQFLQSQISVTDGAQWLAPGGQNVFNWPLNSIIIKKTCSVTRQLLPGATFNLVHTSAGTSGTLGTVIGTFTTGPSGIIVVTGLVPGSYVVREEQPPQNFTLSVNNTQTAFLAPDGHTVVELNFANDPYGSLLITKRCEITHRPLQHAEFRVTRSDGTVVGASNGLFTTNAQGYILIPNLPPHSYVVTETRSPDGFQIDRIPQTIRVSANGQIHQLHFTNLPYSTLIIRKLDSYNMTPLPDARFDVRRTNGEWIGEFVTDSNGLVEIPGILGWVTITETDPPPGFALDSNPTRTVQITSSAPTVVTFLNPRLGSLTIEKTDRLGAPLAGAQFRVSHQNGALIGYHTTGARGMINLSNLPSGFFFVEETRAPQGFVISEAGRTVEVRTNSATVTTFVNLEEPTLTIRKVDQDGAALPGARFRISEVGGSFREYVTTGTGGTVSLTVPTGTLEILEVQAPAGFVITEPARTVAIRAGQHRTETFVNSRLSTFVIRKIDGTTEAPLQGVVFEVATLEGERIRNATTGSFEFVTDSAGLIRLPMLPAGSYVATETRPLQGFRPADPLVFTVTYGRDYVITVRNYRMPNLTVRKINSITRSPIQGVVFQIASITGERVTNPQTGFFDFVTDANGLIHLPTMQDGTFFVSEIRPAHGYIGLNEAVLLQIDSRTRQQEYLLAIENTPASGLLILKTNPQGVPLHGVEFEVRHADGRLVRGQINDGNQPGTIANSPNIAPNGNFLTDARGMIHLNHLESGVYHIVERRALPGYMLDSTVHVVTVTPGRITTLEVVNERMASLRIHKIDSVTRRGIQGVEFRIFDFITNQEVAGPFITDNEGIIEFTGVLPPGRYTIRETMESPGYLRDTMPRTVEFRSGMVTEIVWENTREAGQIQITKRSSADNQINGLPAGSRLEGAVFEVREHRTGNVMDQFVTDARGVGVSRPLPLGRYLIEEIVAPAFYRRSDTILDVTIEHSGQILRYEFFNEPANVGVEVRKTGPLEVMSGQPIVWNITTIANSSTIALADFYVRDVLPSQAVRLDRIFTGTFNQTLRYSIMFRTNINDTWRVAYDNLLTTTNNALVMSPAALGLRSNEFVTEIMYSFGTVRAGFRSVEAPRIEGTVRDGLQNGYEFVNRIDIGGRTGSEWVVGNSMWVSRVFRPIHGTHPRTGW